MTTIAYFDSSAITKLVVEEDESQAIRAYATQLETRLASRIALVEVVRAARRRDPSTAVRASSTLEAFEMIDVEQRVLERAAHIDPVAVATLDAIHLASALEASPEIDAFVTYDKRLGRAAGLAGLPVESPH